MQSEFGIFLIIWLLGSLLAEYCLNLILVFLFFFFLKMPWSALGRGGGSIAVGYELEHWRNWTGQ